MAQSKTKRFDIELSAYGYGMMALSTAIVILLSQGFFQKTWPDLFATWFTVILAAASGALAVIMVRTHLPALRQPLAIIYVTLLFIILMCCYLTSFFGYSQAYILYFLHPFPEKTFSFAKFMHGMEQAWGAVAVGALIATIAYVIIQIITPSKKPTAQAETMPSDIDGLAE